MPTEGVRLASLQNALRLETERRIWLHTMIRESLAETERINGKIKAINEKEENDTVTP